MPAEIDLSNRRANVAYSGEVPWHGLGFQLPVDATIDEWKVAAGLEWEAVKAPVTFAVPGKKASQLKTFDGRDVLFRSDTQAPLAVVSNRYKAVQPGAVLEFFRDLVGKFHDFEIETAGALRGGAKIWALAKNKEAFKMTKQEVINRYLLLATSYDVTLPTCAIQTSVRVVCSNTLHAALGNTRDAIKVYHTTTFDEEAVKAQLGLDLEWREFCTALEQLAKREVDDTLAENYFKELFYPARKVEAEGTSEKAQGRQVQRMMEIRANAPGAASTAAKGTAYGLVQSVTFYQDHAARARSNDIRLDKAWFGDGATLKRRALTKALELV